MTKNALTILFFLTIAILSGVPESFARPQYLTNLTAIYGDGSCSTCHIMSQGDGQRNFNGTMPSNGTFERRNSNRTLPSNYNGTSDRRNSKRTFGNRNSNRTLPRNSTAKSVYSKKPGKKCPHNN